MIDGVRFDIFSVFRVQTSRVELSRARWEVLPLPCREKCIRDVFRPVNTSPLLADFLKYERNNFTLFPGQKINTKRDSCFLLQINCATTITESASDKKFSGPDQVLRYNSWSGSSQILIRILPSYDMVIRTSQYQDMTLLSRPDDYYMVFAKKWPMPNQILTTIVTL